MDFEIGGYGKLCEKIWEFIRNIDIKDRLLLLVYIKSPK
jgi:hypothetical protein